MKPIIADLRTDLRREIEHLLDLNPSGLSAAELAERTAADLIHVRSIISRLRERNIVRSAKPGAPNTPYVKTDTVTTIAQPNTINKVSGNYVPPVWGHEIARPEGNHHQQHGSRRGNHIYHLDGRVEPV